MISLDYIVENHGWAWAKIGNGEEIKDVSVSYLHDSLKDFADSAIKIQEKKFARVAFYMEPGEHRLELSKLENKNIKFELKLYRNWVSDNMVSEDDYQLMLSGTCTVVNYVNEVRRMLTTIVNDLGPEAYKRKWIEHDFPMDEYLELL